VVPAAEQKGAGELFAEFAPMLDFFESTIGPYPFGDEKMGVVETPHKGMEHQTINAYGNKYAKTPTATTSCCSTNSPTNGSATS
jgi:aminopeptidase N